MKQAYFRFYGGLKHFLSPERRMAAFACSFEISGSVKDMIEALGVPHTEVDLILVNGESADFSWQVQDGDRISVYPRFQSLDIAPLARVRPKPLREPRFILDTHLGRLAAYLRMLGFDTIYRNDYQDEELAQVSRNERRALLTMDRGLLKRVMVTHGYCVRETNARQQLVEVLQRFDLFGAVAPFQRCLHCNAVLQPARKESISHRLPPRTAQYYDEFNLCPACDRVYWKGSHYQRMQRFIERVMAAG